MKQWFPDETRRRVSGSDEVVLPLEIAMLVQSSFIITKRDRYRHPTIIGR